MEIDFYKYSSINDLYRIKSEWNKLLLDSSGYFSIFLTWEWVISWLEIYGKSCQLFIATARTKEGRLVGIAPLKISKIKLPYLNQSISVMRFVGDGERPTPEYIDFIIAKDFQNEIYPKLLKYVLDNCPCMIINLRSIYNESYLLNTFLKIAAKENYHFNIFPYSKCPTAILPETIDLFWRSKSKNFKKKMKEAHRRCERDLNIEVKQCVKVDDIEIQIDQLFQLHHLRWRKDLKNGVPQSFIDFHKALSKRLFEKKWLRLFLIISNKQPIAGILCYKFQGQYFYYQSGRNPGFGYYNIGSVILNHVMEQAINENITIFDFLTGDEPYKYRWATDNRHTKQVYFFKKKVVFYLFCSFVNIKKGLKKVYSRLPLTN